jgi:hypothetical protein
MPIRVLHHRSPNYSPIISAPYHSRQKWFSGQSVLLLALWTVSAVGAFVPTLLNMWDHWPLFFMLASVLFFLALWFSLQWDIAHHYVPQLRIEEWTFQSVSGFVAGVTLGAIVGVGGIVAAVEIRPAADNVQLKAALMLVAAGVGLILGFGTLGWRQVRAFGGDVTGAWWWVGVMAFAWVPALLVWHWYDVLLQGLVVNIYPEAHSIVRILAVEVALLCPSMLVFALIVYRGKAPLPRTSAPGTLQSSHVRSWKLPKRIIAGLLVPPLTVIIAYGGVLAAQALRVERAWVAADGPAGYLSVASDGHIETLPPARDGWDPGQKLRDSSLNGLMSVRVEETRLVLSMTGSQDLQKSDPITRAIEVFSGPPLKRYRSDNSINMVRFSPDSTLLAAGTGQATELDSAVGLSDDHAVHVWSVPEGRMVYTLAEPLYTVRAVAWSPDSRFLAAAGGLSDSSQFNGDNVVRVWRVDTIRGAQSAPPTLVFTLVGHTTSIEALGWSSDGSKLVSRDLNGVVVVWKVR